MVVVHGIQTSEPRTLLLVEDEPITALATRHVLEHRGYRVVVVDNGPDAVRTAVDDASIDLILMDIDLGGGIDGTEAAQQILKHRNVPIVFLTSHTEQSMVNRVRGITRYGYVIKDSGTFVLTASIEMAFDLFEAHRRERDQTARYEAVVEAQPDLMFVMRVDGTCDEAYASDPGSLAVPPDRVAGMNLRELFGDDEASRHIAYYRRCLKTGAVQAFEYELSRDENPRWFEARVSKLDHERVLAIIREVTAARQMKADLDRVEALRRVLVDVSLSCINLPRDAVPGAIRSALGSMASTIGADRAYVFDYDFAAGIAVNSSEWCAPGVSPRIDELGRLPLDTITEAVTLHRAGLPHHVPDLEALPAGSLRSVFEPQGIKSLLTVPLTSSGTCVGCVGFDCVRERHEFSGDEHALLAVFARLLVNLHERGAAEERLRALSDAAHDTAQKGRG